MDFGGRSREDLRRVGLPEADTGGVHARGAERAATTTRSGASPVLRAASAPTRHRRNSDGRRWSNDGAGKAVGDEKRTW